MILLACAAPSGTVPVEEAPPGASVQRRYQSIPWLTLGEPEPAPDPAWTATGPTLALLDTAGLCFAPSCTRPMVHGEHVAEVARREGATVLALRVFGDDGSMRLSDLLGALDWLRRQEGVVAVGLSLGLTDPAGAPLAYGRPEACAAGNPALAAMIAGFTEAGIPVVAAAGDDHLDGFVRAPACLPGVIAVAGTDAEGRLAPWANRWPHPLRLAPGVEVPVAGTSASGSSLAAAAVAGALAAGR